MSLKVSADLFTDFNDTGSQGTHDQGPGQIASH